MRRGLFSAGFFLLGGLSLAQVPGVSREAMWPAPTEADWKKPCLIEWERTFEDAATVARETRKPILICVNMDGEIASEHYAGIRYRQPEITQLYAPYITVIASVYRHTPRDHDEQGRRILCPRFGSVTCGEHIAIEPGLYDKYFEGQRVAPRHIAIELDGEETYDIYYAFDTESVFRTVREGITKREIEPLPDLHTDQPLLDRVTSRRNADITAIETAYTEGDRTVRRRLLERVVSSAAAGSTDLLRLAIFGLDLELARLARQGLAQADSEGAIDLIAEALRVPMEEAEREGLLAALERIGEAHPRARTLLAVQRGLAAESDTLDVTHWSRALADFHGKVELPARAELVSRLDTHRSRSLEEGSGRSYGSEVQLQVAEASLAIALDPGTAALLDLDPRTRASYGQLMYEDAYRAAQNALAAGAAGWRVEAAIALSAFYLKRMEEAHAHAERAVRLLPAGEPGWNSMAVLALFAQSRKQAIRTALINREDWPPSWLTDVNDTYSVLVRHPLGSDDQAVAHHDFLRMLGAKDPARRALSEGLDRFPDSWALHDRLRGSVLREGGVEGLEAAYAERLARLDASPNLPWFAGYALLTIAEFHRRQSANDLAGASYGKAIRYYELGIDRNPESRDSSEHYIALALAGRARLALERGDLESALGDVLASFEHGPLAAASLDGLEITPVMTANTLHSRLQDAGDVELAGRLESALDALDPSMHIPPIFERESRGQGPRGFGRRRN